MSGYYNIYPAQKPVPLSHPELHKFTPPNSITYGSNKSYPSVDLEFSPSGVKSNFRLVGIVIYPLHYIPAQRKLILTKSLTIQIEYEENKYSEMPLTEMQLKIFSDDIRPLIVNKEDLFRFSPPMRRDINEVNYVIITTEALSSSVNPLVEWRTKVGWRAEVTTTNWIYNHYSGYDNQEKIRNFIKDYFTNKGLIWVLIIGDADLVPVRKAYLPYYGNSYIATDLYYSDLDGTWDANNNHLYGEFNGDNVDLYSDVYVGRIPVNNTTNVSNYISKLNKYEKNPPIQYLERILLPSVMLFPQYGYHGRVVNNLIAEAADHAGWNNLKLEDPGTGEVLDYLNYGFHFCHIASHGNWYAMGYQDGTPIFHINEVNNLTNEPQYTILSSIACYTGDFDEHDCIAEALVNKYPGGCIATIMNTRYGWGNPPVMGPSELLNLEFHHSFFWSSYHIPFLGSFFSGAKDCYRNQILNDQVWRYCGYELMLFGDPALPMWESPLHNLSVSYPSSIPLGYQTIGITVMAGGNPVYDAMVCLYKPQEVHERQFTNQSGQVTFPVHTSTPGTMYITVTARNCRPFTGSISVYNPNPTSALYLEGWPLRGPDVNIHLKWHWLQRYFEWDGLPTQDSANYDNYGWFDIYHPDPPPIQLWYGDIREHNAKAPSFPYTCRVGGQEPQYGIWYYMSNRVTIYEGGGPDPIVAHCTDSLALYPSWSQKIVVDSLENIHIVFTSGDSIYYVYSDDKAHTFSKPVAIGEGRFPAIGVSNVGLEVIFLRRNKIYYTRKTEIWTTPIPTYQNPSVERIAPPAFCIDKVNSLAYICIEEEYMDRSEITKLTFDLNSSQITTLKLDWSSNVNAFASPCISLKRNGIPIIVWSKMGKIYLHDGITTTEIPTGDAYAIDPFVSAVGDNIKLIWTTSNGNGNMRQIHYIEKGWWGWTMPIPLTEANLVSQPVITGTGHIFYPDCKNDTIILRYFGVSEDCWHTYVQGLFITIGESVI